MGQESEQTEQKEQKPPEDVLFRDDPILSAIAEDIPRLVETEKKKDEPPVAPDVKPVEEDKGEQPPAKEEPKPKVGIRKRQDSKEIADQVVAAVREVLPLPPPKEEKKADESKKTEPSYDEAALSKEQKEELDDARFLEARDSSWKGRAEELLKFYKRVDEWVESKKSDSDHTFDSNDDEFVEFITKNRPAWADREVVRRARLKEEIKEDVRKEQAPEIKKAKAEATEARLAPRIQAAVEAFESELESQTASEDPLESNIYAEFRKGAAQLANDSLRLANNLAAVDDPKNSAEEAQRYQWIEGFLENQASIFARNGGDARVRDGKSFVSPKQFEEMRQKGSPDVEKSWTFSPGQVLKMLQAYTVQAAKIAIENEEKRVEKLGFQRIKKAANPKQGEETRLASGVKAAATPAPGAVPPKEDAETDHLGRELIDVLELKV